MNKLATVFQLVALAIILIFPGKTLAATWYVNQAGGEDFTDIQSALSSASVVNGDTIIVRDGNYSGANNKNLDFGGKAITLRSESGSASCIIDCQNSGRGFYFHNSETADSIVDGFSISYGNVSGNPSWLDNSGGGILIHTSSPTIKNCLIAHNSASEHGGGVLNYFGSPTFVNCFIATNDAGQHGGGVRSQGIITMIDCEVFNNQADYGAGVSLGLGFGPGPVIFNCLVYSNTAVTGGGGLELQGAEAGPFNASVENCTVVGNSAGTIGGGMEVNTGAAPVVTDSIFWNNTAPASPQIVVLDAVHPTWLDIDYCDVAGGQAGIQVGATSTLTWGANNITADPLFVSVGSYYLSQIAAGQVADSPCVDAGSTTAAGVGLDTAWTRIDGFADSGTVDMGYHYGASGTPACTYSILPESDSVGAGGGSGSINVTTAEACDWSAVSNDAWITIDSGSPGTGNGTVGYTVAANPSASPRTGTITIETETFTIDQAASGPGTYYVPDDYPTIQAALTAVLAGDTVIVRDGTYTGAANRNLDFGGKDITLQSENGPAACIIDCEGAGGGFFLWQGETAAATIARFTIRNGSAGFGGGIYCLNSSPTIYGCVIESCSAAYGAGVTLQNSTASLTNCTIVGNTSNIGASGVFLYGANSSITYCTIADNTAISGGGIFSENSNATVINSIVTGNSATFGPQILVSGSSQMTISYCNVEGGANAAFIDAVLNWGEGNIDRIPRFVGAGDYHLLPISPCVDAGTSTSIISDIDNDPRPYGGQFDMGSDECVTLPGELTQINLEAPANLAILSASPVFKWVANGGTNNAFVVDLSIPGLVPLYTSPATTETSWTMPPGIWNVIPSGRRVYWRVRGADLDQTPSNPIASVEQWSFIKR